LFRNCRKAGDNMKKTIRRRALPVYIAAAAFAVYALIFPLYQMLHFLIAAMVTAAVWLLADRLIKPVTEYIPDEPEETQTPVSCSPETDTILKEAKTANIELSKLSASIGNPAIREKISRLMELNSRIAADAKEDETDIPAIRKFQKYFLPSTLALLHSYDRMNDVSGSNAESARESISRMLDTEVSAFEKQLDALYRNDAMNVDAEIRVMQNLLEREGLLEPDELHRILEDIRKTETTDSP